MIRKTKPNQGRYLMTEEEVGLDMSGFKVVSDCPLRPKQWVSKYALLQMTDQEIEELARVVSKRKFKQHNT